MRKIFTIFLLLSLLISDKIFAQPWLTTGNTVGFGDILGSNNAAPLIFELQGVPRMTLFTTTGYPFNAGFLGLGEQLPEWSLVVRRDNLGSSTVMQFLNNTVTDTGQNAGFIVGIEEDATGILQQSEIGQNMRFLTTPYYSGGWIERMRINTKGYVGIGDFSNGGGTPFIPARRLEILDKSLDSGGVSAPQLRLTYKLNDSTIQSGIYTDFQSKSSGDLWISPIKNITSPYTLSYSEFKTVRIDDPELLGSLFTGPLLNPNLALDVNGQQDIKTINNADTLDHILVWDPPQNLTSHEGRIYWRAANTLGAVVAAQNAAWIDSLKHVEWGTNPLLHNTTIPMINPLTANEYNIFFTGQSLMNNEPADIGIGFPNDSSLKAKLDVVNITNPTGGYSYINQYAARFHNTGTYSGSSGLSFSNGLTAVYATCDVATTSAGVSNLGGNFSASNATSNIGAIGEANDSNALVNIGLAGVAKNGATNIGVGGIASSTGNSSGNIGVSGTANNDSLYNYGIYGFAPITCDPGFSSVDSSLGGGGISPLPCTVVNYAGYFDGDVATTGTYYTLSDEKFKQNIKSFAADSALTLLHKLKPRSYTFNNNVTKSISFPTGRQYGLISEEVEQILPGYVKNSLQPALKDNKGNVLAPAVTYKSLNYQGLVPLLIAGIQQVDSVNHLQQSKLDSQQNKIDTLQAQMARMNAALQQVLNCCQNNSQGSNNPNGRTEDTMSIALSNSTIILDQNSPNPFKEQTNINYFIPSEVQSAQIIFYDNTGMVLKTIPISSRGAGSMLVYASNLSSGIYTFALIADGKMIDSKKMICQK